MTYHSISDTKNCHSISKLILLFANSLFSRGGGETVIFAGKARCFHNSRGRGQILFSEGIAHYFIGEIKSSDHSRPQEDQN